MFWVLLGLHASIRSRLVESAAAALHQQPPVSINQRVFHASVLAARFSLLNRAAIFFLQKTPQLCLFIVQFQNVIKLFVNDYFSFSFSVMSYLRPFVYLWGVHAPQFGKWFWFVNLKGRTKCKKEKKKG